MHMMMLDISFDSEKIGKSWITSGIPSPDDAGYLIGEDLEELDLLWYTRGVLPRRKLSQAVYGYTQKYKKKFCVSVGSLSKIFFESAKTIKLTFYMTQKSKKSNKCGVPNAYG